MTYQHRTQYQQNLAAGIEAEDRRKMAEARLMADEGKCPSCQAVRIADEPHTEACATNDESRYNEVRIARLDADIRRRYESAQRTREIVTRSLEGHTH